jgi:hypothetical protein
MKLSLSSLKTLDYKQLGIDHGEKLVIALIGLMMVAVLYYSNWKGIDKSPNEITEKADKAMQQIEASPWPEKEEKTKAGLGKGDELAEKVALLLTPVSPTGFAIKPLNPPLHPDKTLISTPRWLPVQHMIADAGVADILMKAGVPPLDESFIPRKNKEKEPRSKAMRERMKRREAVPQKKEKKEESEDAIPDELKPKDGTGNGGIGSGGGLAGMGSGGLMGRRKDKDKRRRRDDVAPAVQPAPERKVVAKPVGRGYRFVAVRGIFPLRDQVSELARAMGKPTTEKSLQSLVQLRDFKLERQTRVNRPGADPWSGPWEAVDRESVIQMLENDVNAYAPESVLDGLLDAHICMPYPDRVVGQWGLLSTHPDIKEFNLSDEEVEQQVAYEWKLLEKTKKEEENEKAPPDKRGFMTVTKNMRALTARAQGYQGDDKSVREKILADLKSGNGDKDQMSEQLEDFVRTRASAVDHYILFRYLDISVKSGETYRYRVKLVLTNPFHQKRVEEVTDPSIIEGEERESEFSEPTIPVTVKADAQIYVKRTDDHLGRPTLPYADMDVFQWFASTGTVVNKVLAVQIGQVLGRRSTADVLRPAENVFDSESVLFSTSDTLVGVAPGFSLDPNLHKDLVDGLNKVTSGKRPGVTAPDQTLFVDANGELRIIDGVDQRTDYEKTKSHYDLQNKPFEKLRKSDEGDDMFAGRTSRRSAKRGDDPRRQFGGGRRNKN